MFLKAPAPSTLAIVMPLGQPTPREDAVALERWSLPLGGGLWVHATLVGPLVIGVGAAVQTDRPMVGLALLGVWVVSLLAHEVSHVVAAGRVGGSYPSIVLGPVGGLARPRLPEDPEATVFVAMSGPMANLSLVVIGAFGLAMHDDAELASLFLPMSSELTLAGVTGAATPLLTLCKLLVCVNWPLFVLNLLPAWPFDGAVAMRGLLWPLTGKPLAGEVISRFGLLVGLALLISAWFAHGAAVGVAATAWVSALGVVTIFGAKSELLASRSTPSDAAGIPPRDRQRSRGSANEFDDESLVLVEFSGDAESVSPRADEGATGHRNGPHRSAAEEDDARLDQVLAKLHTEGKQALTPEERGVLDRVSQRLRERRSL